MKNPNKRPINKWVVFVLVVYLLAGYSLYKKWEEDELIRCYGPSSR